MPRPFTIDPKRDRAWLNKALEAAGLKKPVKRQPRPSLGLLGEQILALTPENRIKVQRLVLRLLTEEEADHAKAANVER